MSGVRSPVSSLRRTLSSSNIDAAERIHDFIKIQQQACTDQIPILHRDVTKSSMIIPEQYNSQTLKLCIDLRTLNVLESTSALNWCSSCRSLLPFHVDKDGNSLLHALSLYMFGVHDRNLVLRQLLYQRLFMEASKGPIRNRWMVQNDVKSGMTWNNVLEMASERQQSGPTKYNALSSIHVFAMANILARPIIVCCSTGLNSSVGGIYLPFSRSSSECEKSPIVLGYENGHFVPLISSENLKIGLSKSTPSEDAHHCVPLVHLSYSCLPLKFLLPSEELGDEPDNLRNAYLDVINIASNEGKEQKIIDAAMLKFKTPPAFSIELMWSLEQLATDERCALETNQPHQSSYIRPMQIPPVPTGNEVEYSSSDNVYESLIRCASKECDNNASSNNRLSLCPDCWRTRETSIKRSMEVHKTDNRMLVNPDISSELAMPQIDIQSDFQAITSSRIPISKKSDSQNNEMQYMVRGITMDEDSNKCNYDRLSDISFNQVSMKTEASNYDRLNDLTTTQNRTSIADDDGYMLPIPVFQQKTPADSSKKDIDASVQLVASGASRLTPTPAVGGLIDSIKSKVLCDVAGCLNSIGDDGKHCTVHNPKNMQQTFKVCIMKGCNNSAELNDNFLCMVCFQSQKHNEAGTHAFTLRSMTKNLPPIPQLGSPCPTLSRNPSNLVPEVQTNPFNPNSQKIPEIPAFPEGNQAVGSSRSQVNLGTQVKNSSLSFAPPSVYGGFETFDRTVGSHDAILNWQRGAVGASQGDGFTTTNCLHCGQHAHPEKGGLCNECSKQKSEAMRNIDSAKCINEDCKGKGLEQYSFLCELCYKKQLEAMNLENCNRQRMVNMTTAANQTHNAKRQDFGAQLMNSRELYPAPRNHLEHTLQQQQFQQQQDLHLQQPSHHYVNSDHGGYQMKYPAHDNPSFPNLDQFQQVMPTLVSETKKKCKGLNCDFFGSEEFGGHCSGCFLEITKKESEKQEGIRTYSPAKGGHNIGDPLQQVQRHRCSKDGCQNYGSRARNGYCSECYKFISQ